LKEFSVDPIPNIASRIGRPWHAAEYLGADTQVETRIGEETLMVRLPGRFTAPAGANIKIGLFHVTC
jgi:hypothetical protein